jgi:hypothetical protein
MVRKEEHMVISPYLMVVAILVGVLAAGAANAAGPGLPQGLDGIQQGIADVQNSVDSLIAPDQSNVRSTPPIAVSFPQLVVCSVANVTGVNQKVQVDQVNFNGTVIISTTFDPLQPGQATGLGSLGVQGLTAPRWCRFIVIDGSRTAIRAAITVSDTSTSAPATLPAE